LSGLRPAFSWVCGCTERKPPTIDDELLGVAAKAERLDNLAAFGLGEVLNTPFGPMISGDPSLAYTGSTGRPAS